MSESQPTHKVVWRKGAMLCPNIYEAVPIDEKEGDYNKEVPGKRGTFEECQAYAERCNEAELYHGRGIDNQMSESQPTHKVVYNRRDMYEDAKGILQRGFFQVVPIKEESLGEDERKRGTFEECQAYADELNKKGHYNPMNEPSEGIRDRSFKDLLAERDNQ